jgi:hypothetical protein
MYPAFDRFDHNYDPELDCWLNFPDPGRRDSYRAMARNVMHDHRVDPQVEQVFHNIYAATRPLQTAIELYKLHRVRTPVVPDFLRPALNQSNFVAGALNANFIDEDTDLVRLLDLNGLTPVYQWAKSQPAHALIFWDYGDGADENETARWLSGKLPAGAETLVPGLLAALRAYRRAPGSHHYPVWAALWEEVGVHLQDSSPDRWLELVGVYAGTFPRWIVPLRYKVLEAGTLVRPSILEAGWSAHHFPSPRTAPLPDGGYSMDLLASPRATSLIREYIHQEIDFQERHWRDAGGLCRPTTRAGNGALAQQRQTHYDLLCGKCTQVRDWMSECV